MAVTIADVRAAERDFASTDHPTDAEVQTAIDRAERLYDETTLDDRYDDAVLLKVCQTLARKSFARDLRLVKNGQQTIFDEELRAVLESVGRENRVVPA